MATASAIVRRAYRESNLIPMGQTPSLNQMNEALELLNSILMSTVGNEVSDNLVELVIGGDFDQQDKLGDYIPPNTRLVFNLEDGPIVMGLDPYPRDGQRVAMVDTSGNISTNTITLNANGRLIEGNVEVTMDVDYQTRQWLYRADAGNWVAVDELEEDDNIPFPTEFDDYFVTMLAMRLNPRYGQALSAESQKMLSRVRSQLNARYTQRKEILPDLDYRSIPSQRASYTSFSTDDFDTGSV